MLGKPTPLWFGSYTSYLLYKDQDLFSACRQSHGQNSSSSSIFREDKSLLHRPRNSGRECAWWTNSLVGRFLHQLSLAQSSRSIQHMQTVPWPKQFFFNFSGGPLFASQTKKLRKRMCLVAQLPCGSVPTPAISCTKLKIYSAHADSPMAKTFLLIQFLGRTSLCFTDQQTQEENKLDGLTPLWVSSYPSYLLYKAQDLFSACRQSHGQNRTSLCFTNQQTHEENVRGGPTPLWVSSYTSYLLYKAQELFSACSCRQSYG